MGNNYFVTKVNTWAFILKYIYFVLLVQKVYYYHFNQKVVVSMQVFILAIVVVTGCRVVSGASFVTGGVLLE